MSNPETKEGIVTHCIRKCLALAKQSSIPDRANSCQTVVLANGGDGVDSD